MAIKRGSKVDAGFSAASMTDLMFLLLIFMLVATTLINPNALKLLLPKAANQVKEKPYTTVSITADLEYYVDAQPVALDDLENVLVGKLQGMDKPIISLHMDKSVPVGEMTKVLVIANDNKYQVLMATTPK